MTEQVTNLGHGLSEWATVLRQHGYANVVEALDDDKMKTLRRLSAMGLPHYRTYVDSLSNFLAHETTATSSFDLNRLFVALNPRNRQHERKRTIGITEGSIGDFVAKHVKPDAVSDYDIILQETFLHYYGGNIACGSDGAVTLELIKGSLGHNELVTARRNPQYSMHRNPLTNLFRTQVHSSLGEVDAELPAAIWRTLLSIPHIIDNDHADSFVLRGLEFTPGYYEFFLDRRTETSSLEPFFIDANHNQAFIP